MSGSFSILIQVISFLKTIFDLLPKGDSKIDERITLRAERFLYLATKIEMSLTDLILHLCYNQSKIIDFLSKVKRGNSDVIQTCLKDLFCVFPLPEVLKLPEEDMYALILNRLTKELRNEIDKTNAAAEALKEDSANVKLLSQLYIYLDILTPDYLLNDYARLVQFKIETANLILGKESKVSEIKVQVDKSVRILKGMCSAHQRSSYEFNRKLSEIKEKLKHFQNMP